MSIKDNFDDIELAATSAPPSAPPSEASLEITKAPNEGDGEREQDDEEQTHNMIHNMLLHIVLINHLFAGNNRSVNSFIEKERREIEKKRREIEKERREIEKERGEIAEQNIDEQNADDVVRLGARFQCNQRILAKEINRNAELRLIRNITLSVLFGIASFVRMQERREGENNFLSTIILATACCLTAIYESIEKRNVAAICYFNQSQISTKIESLKMVARNLATNNPRQYDADDDADVIAKLSKQSFLLETIGLTASLLKFLSYFSGNALLVCGLVYNFLHDDIKQKEKVGDYEQSGLGGFDDGSYVYLTYVSPVMPLINSGIWFAAACLSQIRVQGLEDKYIVDYENLVNFVRTRSQSRLNQDEEGRGQKINALNKLKKSYESYIEDKNSANGDISKNLLRSDDYLHPCKFFYLSAYVWSRFRMNCCTFLPESLLGQNTDITQMPRKEEMSQRMRISPSPPPADAHASLLPGPIISRVDSREGAAISISSSPPLGSRGRG